MCCRCACVYELICVVLMCMCAAGNGRRVEQLKAAWGISGDGEGVAQFNSLNSVIMSEGHRPEAFRAMCNQLEKLWEVMRVCVCVCVCVCVRACVCVYTQTHVLSKASHVVQHLFFLYHLTGCTQKWHSIPVATTCAFST